MDEPGAIVAFGERFGHHLVLADVSRAQELNFHPFRLPDVRRSHESVPQEFSEARVVEDAELAGLRKPVRPGAHQASGIVPVTPMRPQLDSTRPTDSGRAHLTTRPWVSFLVFRGSEPADFDLFGSGYAGLG